ncbi:GNAT family protein [Longispora sp. K20-0274]|uniref:GNAT family N-acetyltransferase n=1 Tax=Longispora sp. K20-0274 TaxID=3088255 RepID=UPI00399ACF00
MAAPIDPVEIVAGNLQLRPPHAPEGPAAWLMLQDPAVDPAPGVTDEATATAWCQALGDWSAGDQVTLSILEITEGNLLGMVHLDRIDQTWGTAKLGYRIAPWARDQDIETDAIGAVTRWAFGALGLERVEFLHLADRPDACRVATAAGYALEGTRRGGQRAADGTRHDDHLHARLATD